MKKLICNLATKNCTINSISIPSKLIPQKWYNYFLWIKKSARHINAYVSESLHFLTAYYKSIFQILQDTLLLQNLYPDSYKYSLGYYITVIKFVDKCWDGGGEDCCIWRIEVASYVKKKVIHK